MAGAPASARSLARSRRTPLAFFTLGTTGSFTLTLACGDWVAGFLHLSFNNFVNCQRVNPVDKVSAGFLFMFGLLEGFPGFPTVSRGFPRGFWGFLWVSLDLVHGFGKSFVRVSVGFRAVFELSEGFP